MFLMPPRLAPSYSTAGATRRAPCRSTTSRAGLPNVKSCMSTAPRRSITTSTLPAAGTTLTALTSPSRRAPPLLPGLAPPVRTSRSGTRAAMRFMALPPAWRCRVSPPPRGWAWPGRPADPLRAARRRTPRIACSPCAPRALLGRCTSRRRRLHERADPELRLEQRAERVAQQLLRLLRRRLEDHVLRNDDARQARDVGQELA